MREYEKEVDKELDKEDIKKLESIACTFANKSLNPAELEKVEGVLRLSLLGQMIFEDGIEIGMEKSVVKIVTTVLRKDRMTEKIHEDTDILVEQMLKIRESLGSHSSER